MKTSMKRAIMAIGLLFLASEAGDGLSVLATGNGGLISTAQARVGRPATPGSVAGVARRTTRRTIRRGAYVARVPKGCPYGAYYGYNLYYCGGTYYQKSGSGYVIVYF
ncbi:hypothetical protein [Aestuariivirga sp.]|jgi:hypothetical protein|uniref:hypothetical protein n=1 Tax=Aestuariivirga sp. TaxID=2650926 RepID=UPI003BAC8959